MMATVKISCHISQSEVVFINQRQRQRAGKVFQAIKVGFTCCTLLHLWIVEFGWFLVVARKEMKDTTQIKPYEGMVKGIRCWRMGSRVNRMKETEQLKAEKKHPTITVSGTNAEKIQRLFMPRNTKPWSSHAMLRLQCKRKNLSGNKN